MRQGRILPALAFMLAAPPALAADDPGPVPAPPAPVAGPALPPETLAQALDNAYNSAPQLQAQRYTLRADDEDYAAALAETRLTTQVQVTGSYDKTVPGETTQATRYFATSPIETANTLAAVASATQPILTGGKAAADRTAALAEIRMGRAQLRATEGDTLLQVITSYADVRRDTETMRLRAANLDQLRSTLDEVDARREAGQLTRTDVGLARQQLWLAQSLYVTTDQSLEQERATYATVVGHDPGNLAPLPPLPGLPHSIDEALHYAADFNPDLAQAIAQEQQTRAQIASAEAASRPTLSLTGTATLTGTGLPYYLKNQDQEFAGQVVLTIPLTSGGAVGAAVAKARDTNSAARLGIEYARRQMVQRIVNAWNAVATAQRTIVIETEQVAAAKVYDEGTDAEYREGLRSTFDVLYAHGVLRDAEIARLGAVHDLYVAQATLLRYIGLLEVRALMTGGGLYDPQIAFDKTRRRGASPLDAIFEGVDSLERPPTHQPGLVQPPTGSTPATVVPATGRAGVGNGPEAPMVRAWPGTPVPGTTGIPITRGAQ
jgi:outer membrane protein